PLRHRGIGGCRPGRRSARPGPGPAAGCRPGPRGPPAGRSSCSSSDDLLEFRHDLVLGGRVVADPLENDLAQDGAAAGQALADVRFAEAELRGDVGIGDALQLSFQEAAGFRRVGRTFRETVQLEYVEKIRGSLLFETDLEIA